MSKVYAILGEEKATGTMFFVDVVRLQTVNDTLGRVW